MGRLSAGQLWGLVTAVLGAVATIAVAGYKVGTWESDRRLQEASALRAQNSFLRDYAWLFGRACTHLDDRCLQTPEAEFDARKLACFLLTLDKAPAQEAAGVTLVMGEKPLQLVKGFDPIHDARVRFSDGAEWRIPGLVKNFVHYNPPQCG